MYSGSLDKLPKREIKMKTKNFLFVFLFILFIGIVSATCSDYSYREDANSNVCDGSFSSLTDTCVEAHDGNWESSVSCYIGGNCNIYDTYENLTKFQEGNIFQIKRYDVNNGGDYTYNISFPNDCIAENGTANIKHYLYHTGGDGENFHYCWNFTSNDWLLIADGTGTQRPIMFEDAFFVCEGGTIIEPTWFDVSLVGQNVREPRIPENNSIWNSTNFYMDIQFYLNVSDNYEFLANCSMFMDGTEYRYEDSINCDMETNTYMNFNYQSPSIDCASFDLIPLVGNHSFYFICHDLNESVYDGENEIYNFEVVNDTVEPELTCESFCDGNILVSGYYELNNLYCPFMGLCELDSNTYIKCNNVTWDNRLNEVKNHENFGIYIDETNITIDGCNMIGVNGTSGYSLPYFKNGLMYIDNNTQVNLINNNFTNGMIFLDGETNNVYFDNNNYCNLWAYNQYTSQATDINTIATFGTNTVSRGSEFPDIACNMADDYCELSEDCSLCMKCADNICVNQTINEDIKNECSANCDGNASCTIIVPETGYVPTYRLPDLALITGDVIGTAGVSAVDLIGLLALFGVIAIGIYVAFQKEIFKNIFQK